MVLPEGRGCGSHASVDGSYENRFWGEGLEHTARRLRFRLGNGLVLDNTPYNCPFSYPHAVIVTSTHNTYLESPPD